jgi:ribokinase
LYDRHGVNTDYVSRDSCIHTGVSVILIAQDGHNMISVAPGANYKLSEEDIDLAETAFLRSCLVGFQLENRLEVVAYAIRKVHALGVTTLLDPAPAAILPDDLFRCIDYIKPNEHEAEVLTGIPVRDVEGARLAGRWFIEHGVKTAIITLGELGAVWVSGSKEGYCLPPAVQAFDTTGAGDTFSGAFMAAFSQGKPPQRSR